MCWKSPGDSFMQRMAGALHGQRTVIGREQEYLSTSLLLFRIRQLPPSPPLWGPGGCDCMSEKSRAPAVLRNRRGTQAGCRANTEKNIFSLRQSRAEA